MLRIALLQVNPTVGALRQNREQMLRHAEKAMQQGARLIVFPELALTGYPPEDLLQRPQFLAEVAHSLEWLAQEGSGIDWLIGAPLVFPVPAAASRPPESPSTFAHTAEEVEAALRHGKPVNAAVWLSGGSTVGHYAKQQLPNYSVFDEQRYFTAGHHPGIHEIAGWRLGVTICEDIWFPEPVAQSVSAGAQLILNINASPFHRGKVRARESVVRARVQETGVPVVYLNLVGGQDELVFDGRSFVATSPEQLHPLLPAWVEGMALLDLPDTPPTPASAATDSLVAVSPLVPSRQQLQFPPPDWQPPEAPGPVWKAMLESGSSVSPVTDREALDAYCAILTGIRDYVRKNGFSGVLLGLSGGIDSALTAALAVDALGPEAVEAVMMPYHYTASMSIEDARQEAAWLGIDYREVSIEPMVEAFRAGLRESFADQQEHPADVTEQNLQSRCRGVLLMALSNRTGRLLLATGNKSELAVGYATLYGDMSGGFAPLKDLTKHWVYRLAHVRNQISQVIPARVLERPPSAELAPGQEDIHSLPPYPVLDAILEAFVEEEQSVEQIVRKGFDARLVERIARMVLQNEFKRRQAAPGVRVSARAFGKDRRYPITSGYRS